MLFNLAGYRFVFSFQENKATQKLEASIDAGNYTDANLVEIKMPLNMPYVSDKSYEAAYGETSINGEIYRYVKRKISNNTLFLLCIPHREKTNALTAKHEFEKNIAGDSKENNQQKNPLAPLFKLMQTEFLQNDMQYPADDSQMTIASLPETADQRVACLFTPLTAEQPPEFFS